MDGDSYPAETTTKTLTWKSPHDHSFTYSASGATITATCSNTEGCPLESSSYQATLTISAAGGTYDGTTTYGATVTNNIPAVDGVTVGEIEYYKVSTQGATTGGTTQTGAPTDAGYYYASVTLTSGSNSYTAVKAFTISPKALTITGATLTARNYAEDDKNVTVSAVTFDNATLTLGTDYTATAEMANDTAGSAKPATVTVTLTNGNYSLAQNTYTSATVQINKIEYTGSKTAAANLRGTNGATAEVTLPALPTGASYGAVTNSNTDYFTVGTVADGKVTVTAAKDFNQATESADKTFTVAVSGATNYNNYTVTVTITPIFKSEQTITAENVTATYGDTDKSVSASTNGGGAISYAVTDGSRDYIDVAADGKLTIKKAGTATVTVTAAETADYAAATKDVIVTISKAAPSYTVPTGLTATYGQTLADLTLPNADNGAWSWNDATTTSVGNAGNNTFKATFTPTNTDNYNTISNVDVTVTVGQAQQTAPALKILAQPDTPYANGSIGNNGASVSTERLQVSTDGGKAWTDVTTLPYAAKPGTYQFMYKGDNNHAASEVTKLLVEPVNELREVKITSDKTDANLYKSGETNTLTAVTNTNVTGLTLEYAWYREGVAETVGSGNTYALQAADVGKKLTVVVTDKTTGAPTDPAPTVSTATPVIVTVAPTTYLITGKVTVLTAEDGSTSDNVTGASVELRQGNTVFAPATTDGEGNYTFSTVPNGEYNIVVIKADDGKTKTERVVVKGANQTINVVMPYYAVSSKVVVSGETPAAVVAGLDTAVVDSLTNDEKASGVTTTMTMEIESSNDLTAKAESDLTDEQKQVKTEQQKIKEKNTGAGASANLDFLDMSVYKRTQKTGESAQVEDVHNLNNVLEILLPYTTANRSFNIFRYHGTAATKFTRLTTRPTGIFTDGEFFVGDGFIAIYASGFSTYAIGYSASSSSGPAPVPATTPAYNSGDSSSDSDDYINRIVKSDNGTVSVNRDTASNGEKVTITVKPNAGYAADTVTVTGSGGRSASVTKVNNTTYTYIQPGMDVKINVTFKPVSGTAEANCPLSAFTDADAKAWYHDGVHWALENGVMNGVGGGQFDPNGETSRAMVVTMLWRLEGSPAYVGKNEFDDVKSEDWYGQAVRWASAEGIVTGYEQDGGKVFNPNGAVTREQLATMLYRYAQHKGQGFTGLWSFPLDYPDASSVSEWAYEAMCWMTMNGVINGMDGKLAPASGASRAQVATMLMRYCTSAAK